MLIIAGPLATKVQQPSILVTTTMINTIAVRTSASTDGTYLRNRATMDNLEDRNLVKITSYVESVVLTSRRFFQLSHKALPSLLRFITTLITPLVLNCCVA